MIFIFNFYLKELYEFEKNTKQKNLKRDETAKKTVQIIPEILLKNTEEPVLPNQRVPQSFFATIGPMWNENVSKHKNIWGCPAVQLNL